MPDSPFPPVPAQPDFPEQELATLVEWRERRTFARLREQLAGGPRWSFLDGPITANNPMGVHHAWGRTYKDVFQRFHAMLGHDQRFQNGFDCQGLWVEVNVEKDLGFTSKRDIERYGLAEFVTLCKQRVLTYAALQTEQSIRLGMWMDWNDPAELRRLRDLLGEDPSQLVTIEGAEGPVTDTVEMTVGRLGMKEIGGSYFTFSDENNDLIWFFLAECHRRGWLYKGHDSMPWCARCGTGLSQTEVNDGYQDREDPGLTVKLPLRDRPGESLLVWTTTPWTMTSNVAAAVGPEMRYVKVRQNDEELWLGKGTLRTALVGPFEVLEERAGSELVGWRYDGPYDELPAVQHAFGPDGERAGRPANAGPAEPYQHRVVPWDLVGEEEGTGIVHIAPGAGAEDFELGKELVLPVIVPIDENGIVIDGFGSLTGRDVRDLVEPVVEHLRRTDRFYRLKTYLHRYPHCWRCGTPLVWRVVDEWYISMGEVYAKPRAQLTADEVDRSLRYQIMEVVDGIRWLPGFGNERELDWLLNMHDWMISKKRYWGLALPIYDCQACGTFDVIAGREELRQRAIEGWERFEGHTPHRPYVDEVKIACRSCGAPVSRIPDVGNPWLDAGIVPFSTLHFREDAEYWANWFPADFITESFPGQFRNWFYSMLAMSTVLRRELPFKTIFGYATLFAEDGRPMHKSSGNAIEFNEAADRMGVDVMRWMYGKARPEDNFVFGYHAADGSRRELLVLWNVFRFFVERANVAGWRAGPPVPAGSGTVLDRWIASRTAALAADVRKDLEEYDLRAATLTIGAHIDELSQWYLRRSRRRFSQGEGHAERDVAFATLHGALVALARILAPVLPFLAERLYGVLVGSTEGPDPSVHLTAWPDGELASARDEVLEHAMSRVLRAVDLARTLRSQSGLKTRQPLASAWLALPGGVLAASLGAADRDALLALLADEVNVKRVELIGDESALVERRVKPLLPVIGKKLGARVPAVMAAARANEVEYLPGGGVRLAGVELAAYEVEILATPRAGTAVAHDEGIVVVLDTVVTPELRAEGDARELIRATQDLRKQAELALDDRIEVWVSGVPTVLEGLRPHLTTVAADTQADAIHLGEDRAADAPGASVELSGGTVTIRLRPVGR